MFYIFMKHDYFSKSFQAAIHEMENAYYRELVANPTIVKPYAQRAIAEY